MALSEVVARDPGRVENERPNQIREVVVHTSSPRVVLFPQVSFRSECCSLLTVAIGQALQSCSRRNLQEAREMKQEPKAKVDMRDIATGMWICVREYHLWLS